MSSAEGGDDADSSQPCLPFVIVTINHDKHDDDDDYDGGDDDDDDEDVLPESIFHTANKAEYGRNPIIAKRPFATTCDNPDDNSDGGGEGLHDDDNDDGKVQQKT